MRVLHSHRCWHNKYSSRDWSQGLGYKNNQGKMLLSHRSSYDISALTSEVCMRAKQKRKRHAALLPSAILDTSHVTLGGMGTRKRQGKVVVAGKTHETNWPFSDTSFWPLSGVVATVRVSRRNPLVPSGGAVCLTQTHSSASSFYSRTHYLECRSAGCSRPEQSATTVKLARRYGLVCAKYSRNSVCFTGHAPIRGRRLVRYNTLEYNRQFFVKTLHHLRRKTLR